MMKSASQDHSPAWPSLAWLSVALTGFIAPAGAILLLSSADAPLPVMGPILAVGMMGAGMIAAAAAGRLWVGVMTALLSGCGLILVANTLGPAFAVPPASIAMPIAAASISFAARGALFARSASARGWWIAVFVLAGEAAILITASIDQALWPVWLLALLPAQWTSMAIEAALISDGSLIIGSPVIALGATAAGTLLVAHLWPRRWPYIVMFTTWLAMSALVYHQPDFSIAVGNTAAAQTVE